MSDKIPKPNASTQDHLDMEDIVDDLVLLKTGWVALVMTTTAVNFDLLSEAEQDATIYAYGAFLNSLTFPIEILIRSKKADISAYFQTLEEAEKVQPNPDLKAQIQKYEEFIQATVQQRTVLEKKFYIVITHSGAASGFGNMGKKVSSARVKKQTVETAKAALAPRRDHVIKQLARLGLGARQLSSQELVELFYDIYNPAPTGTQRIILDSASYTAPLVEPAIENPAPAKISESAPVAQVSEQKADSGIPPHAEVSVGQQDAVVEIGLRPVPPRGIGDIGVSDKSESQMNQKTAESPGAQPAAGQTQAQVDALKELEKAVAAAAQLSGSTTTAQGSPTGQPGTEPDLEGGVKI